jgi:hypothetical protein
MESQLPSPSYVWGMLPIRFEIELTRHKSEICRLCGLYEEYGSDDGNFNAEREEVEIVDELTKSWCRRSLRMRKFAKSAIATAPVAPAKQ